jgi:hypothetical protein
MPYRSKTRQIVEIDAGVPCFAEPVADLRQGEVRRLDHHLQQPISIAVERRSPPCGRAATVPRRRHACVSLTTKLGLTANIAATVRTRRGRAASRIDVRARMAS